MTSNIVRKPLPTLNLDSDAKDASKSPRAFGKITPLKSPTAATKSPTAAGRTTPTAAGRTTPTAAGRTTPRRTVNPAAPRSPNTGNKSGQKSPIAQLKEKLNTAKETPTSPRDYDTYSRSNYRSNYGRTRVGDKSFRDMWKAPEDQKEDSDDNLTTKVAVQNDCEVFQVEDNKQTDFEKRNREEALKFDPSMLVQDEVIGEGNGLVTDEISTQAAYQLLTQIEERGQSQPEPLNLFPNEPTSQKLQKLSQELEQLEKELQELQKEEMPTKLQQDSHSSKTQLRHVDQLRKMLVQIQPNPIEALSNLKDLQVKTQISKILEDKKLNTQAKTSELVQTIELWVKHEQMDQSKVKSEIKSNYEKLLAQVSEVEAAVGGQTELLCKEVDLFSIFTHFQRTLPQLNDLKHLDQHGKEYLQLLEQVEKQLEENKLKQQQTQVDQLYEISEKSLEQFDNFVIIRERFRVLDTIHQASVNMNDRIKAIGLKQQKEISDTLNKEKSEIAQTKESMQKAVKEVDGLL